MLLLLGNGKPFLILDVMSHWFLCSYNVFSIVFLIIDISFKISLLSADLTADTVKQEHNTYVPRTVTSKPTKTPFYR